MPLQSSQTSGGGPRWSSERAFALVGIGSVVGLGNLWDLPYLAGRHGGGAFLLVYAAGIALIAAPLLAAELVIGRRMRRNPVDAMAHLARREGRARLWQVPAWLAAVASIVMLAIYGVVGGWVLAYLWQALRGEPFTGAVAASQRFSALLGSPRTMAGWHLAFLGMAALVAAAGVRRGVERAARWCVPALIVILVGFAGHAALRSANFGAVLTYLLWPDFARLDGAAVLHALRHACFTLSLGVGVMTAYGAYLPDEACIPRSSRRIAVADAVVSLLAGLAIFPLLFATGVEPVGGPALAFVAVPTALAELRGGATLAILFFLLLFLAALTSGAALLEPATAVAQERLRLSRAKATTAAAGAAAVSGLVLLLAFNELAGLRIGGAGLFAFVNGVLAGVLLPLAAAGTAFFAGHVVSRRVAREELGLCGGPYRVWWLLVRWAAPAGVALAVFGLQS